MSDELASIIDQLSDIRDSLLDFVSDMEYIAKQLKKYDPTLAERIKRYIIGNLEGIATDKGEYRSRGYSIENVIAEVEALAEELEAEEEAPYSTEEE